MLCVSTNESVVFYFIVTKAASVPLSAGMALELHIAVIVYTAESDLF
jgi:hypothetical protein